MRQFRAGEKSIFLEYLERIEKEEKITFVPAKENILSDIEDKKILMLNENHYFPGSRSFLKNLLQDLYNKGFSSLAAEGISNNTYNNYRALDEVKKGNGFYVNEPEFADLLRVAKDLGMRLYSYSPAVQDLAHIGKEKEREEYRDRVMFENIKMVYETEIQPDEKMIVLCGHGHIKKSFVGGQKFLGQWLNEWKGEEVLFVEQSMIPEFSTHSLAENLLDKLTQHTVPVLVQKDGKDLLKPLDKICDKVILHPRTQIVDGAADWVSPDENNTVRLDYTCVNEGLHYAGVYFSAELDAHGIADAVPYKIFPFRGRIHKEVAVRGDDYVFLVFDQLGNKIHHENL